MAAIKSSLLLTLEWELMAGKGEPEAFVGGLYLTAFAQCGGSLTAFGNRSRFCGDIGIEGYSGTSRGGIERVSDH
jgi:hypothetical protein